MEAMLNIASAIFALLAAGAWAYSACAVTIYEGAPIVKPEGARLPAPALFYGMDRKGRQIDLIPTLIKQSKWSRNAAILTAIAAVCQALAAI